MTKPILWLGPLEDIDADFDPLLGRSAKEALAPSAVAAASKLSPNRSVFDEPDAAEAPVPESPNKDPFVFESTEEVLSSDANVFRETAPEFEAQGSLKESVSEIVTLATESVAAQEPDSRSPVVDAPMDYSHNNDTIPERLATPSEDIGIGDAANTEQLVEATNKSFLTRLFTAKPVAKSVAVTAVAVTSTIGVVAKRGEDGVEDIWDRIKSDSKEGNEPKASLDAGTPLSHQAEPISPGNEPAESLLDSQDVEPIVDAGDKAVAEANIEIQSGVGAGDDDAATEVIDTQTEQTAIVDEAPLGNDEAASASEATVEPTRESQGEIPTPALESEIADQAGAPEASIETVESAFDVSSNETQIVATTSEVQDGPDVVSDQVEPTQSAETGDRAGAHPFQRAFNADRFWTVAQEPRSEVPTELISSIEDLDPPEEDASSPSEAVSEPSISSVEEAPVAAAPALRVGKDDRPLDPNESRFADADQNHIAPAEDKASQAKPRGPRRKKKAKKNYVGAFFGTFLFGITLIMTLVSSLAAVGYPFDLISSYRWYWVILGVVCAAIWGVSRGWKMVLASFAVIGLNLMVTVPASGIGPVGGKMAAAVIGWANLNNSDAALARVIKDADAKGATLVMLAEAPASVFKPPAGWSLIEAPVANDPTAIAVLSKGSWRAATVPGEPTMARPPAGDITIIGVHPQDAQKGRRSTPVRDALINRAAARAGIQEGPTIVLGDFNAAPWARAMRQFRDYGGVTRVRCGGWAGGTYTQAFGLIGVATDHAYVRDVKVTHCKLGATLPGGNQKPIWLYVAPQAAAQTLQTK